MTSGCGSGKTPWACGVTSTGAGRASANARIHAASAAEDPAKYPSQSIRFIVPFTPGGTTDYVARTVQPKMQDLIIDCRQRAVRWISDADDNRIR